MPRLATKEAIIITPYDTTLRDGNQTPGVNLSVGTKLRIAERLDREGFPYIEGGWPGANPTDTDFFRQLRGHKFQHAQLVVFGMTGRVGVKPENDPSLQTLLEAETGVVEIFGKSWLLHVEKVLRTTPEANLQSIHDSVAYLSQQGRRVFYAAEHFFDGYRNNSKYALSTLEAAQSAGAETIILCDTNGGATPEFVSRATRAVRKRLGQEYSLGIHVHNDRGLAVASTIAAVRAGATQVQGTINGAGERTGNVDLCVFIPTAKLGYGIETMGVDLARIPELANFIETENGLRVPANHPWTGLNAFTHKGGVHVDAVRKEPDAYQHVQPELVGRQTSFESSDQGGGANIMEIASKYGYQLEKTDPRVREMVDKMKELGVLGDAQEYLLLYRGLSMGPEPFETEDQTYTSFSWESSYASSDVSISIRVGRSRFLLPARTGLAPSGFGAFEHSLKETLGYSYGVIRGVRIWDYRTRSTLGQEYGSEDTEVYLELGFGDQRWSSKVRGNSTEIASQKALVEGYKYAILKFDKNKAVPR